NPHGKTPNGFSYQLRLSPPPNWRLWSGLSLHPSAWALGAARLVSTPSCRLFRRQAWLGIAILQGSPNLSSSASRVSRESTQHCKSVASTVPPRPHAVPIYTGRQAGGHSFKQPKTGADPLSKFTLAL